MAKDTLIARLNASADAEIANILQHAEDEILSLKKEAQGVIAAHEQETQAELDRRVEAVKRQVHADRSRRLRSLEVQKRRELFVAVRERVLTLLLGASQEDRVALLSSLIVSIDASEGVIIPAADFTAEVKLALKEAKKSYEIGEEDASLQGGFRFESGAMMVDASFVGLVDAAMADHESDVARVLFGEEEN